MAVPRDRFIMFPGETTAETLQQKGKVKPEQEDFWRLEVKVVMNKITIRLLVAACLYC
jgi:hypothetical protein